METRGRAKAQAAQSSSTPVNPLEGSGPRPPSRVSEVEGDLGLTSLLGGGEVLNVEESHTQESAMSGISDVTVVAAQVPITESGLVTSYGQTEADSVDPLLAATRTTTLPGSCAQAPIGSTQVPTLSLNSESVPVQIPTLISSGPGGQAKLDEWPTCTSVFNRVKSVEHDYCVANDDREMYWDENIDPYFTRNVTCVVYFMLRYHSLICHMVLIGPGHFAPWIEGMVKCLEILQVLVTPGQSHVVCPELQAVLQRPTLNGLEILCRSSPTTPVAEKDDWWKRHGNEKETFGIWQWNEKKKSELT